MAANGTYRLLQGRQRLLLRGVGLRQAALGRQQRQAASLVGASLSFFFPAARDGTRPQQQQTAQLL